MKDHERNIKRLRGLSWVNICYLCVVTALVVCIIRGINNKREEDAVEREISSGSDLAALIQQIMRGQPINLPQDDPIILQLIREMGIVQAPNGKPYNLTQPNTNPSMGQGQYIRQLFRNTRNGFFVECRALDGEAKSNTLTLEMELGWEGLLLEASPGNFESLTKKNRRTWLAQACLAVEPYPHEASPWQHYILENISGVLTEKSGNVSTVMCFPFYTLMRYLNVTHVDYFSLNVDGNELDVLKTIPFSSFLVKTLSVKLSPIAARTSEIVGFMESLGYVNVATINAPNTLPNDIIFVHSSETDLLDNSSPV